MYYRFLRRSNDATTLFVIRESFGILDGKNSVLLAIFSAILLIPIVSAEASSNPNLFVSAENPQFDNYFSGSMVIEVVIRDSNLSDTDQGKGEPDVTLNGNSLRMVQATDGNWYAYFANVDKAKIADSTVGLDGKGLDFGVFCSSDTASSVFGISISETDGVAVPRSFGLADFTDGTSSFNACTGSPTNSKNLNNVVRQEKSINTNSNIPTGQIGLDSHAWPLIQLYSFDDVTIQYNPGGSSQQVSLEYDEIPNIALNLDRNLYPVGAEVFLTIDDLQLNQDPTDVDSWTFDINSNSVFYQAFDDSGSSSANGGAGLVDLSSTLSSLGFEDNGQLSLNLGSVMKLQTNDHQPTSSVTDGGSNTFSQIITLVEQEPNSGIFTSYDDGDQSVIEILGDASRGQTGQITYNKKSLSVLTGSSTASVVLNTESPVSLESSISLGNGTTMYPGTKYPVVLTDSDQNLNTSARDDLDVFRETAIIPTLTIGSPLTVENAQNAKFHPVSPTLTVGVSVTSIPDSNSDRFILDTSTVSAASYEMFSINLGISAATLASTLLDVSESNVDGTNWINYDLRSFENDLEYSTFNDTTFSLSFGTLGDSSITIVDAGDVSSPQGFIQLDDSDVESIVDQSGTVFLAVDFDSSDDDSGVISIDNEQNNQPIVFDFFSFGLQNDENINNSIYRFELEETQDNSSTFDGTFEYAVTNQLNILDASFIQTIQTIDDEIKIIITGRLIDEEGITISYSDLDVAGVTDVSTTTDVFTHSGTVSTAASTYRFGQPVTVTLQDSDLNLKNDTVDIYFVIDDPNSVNVDTVGKDGEILLEIKLKDIRYKRCTVNGVEHGGLGATGFTLVETGPSTGIFEGTFKMPSQICDESGTKLISPAGGSLDAKYYDSRDSFGNSNTFSLLRNNSAASFYTSPQLSTDKVVKPLTGQLAEITLSGNLDNHKRGIPLSVVIISPDGTSQSFGSVLSNSGSYRSIISINDDSLPGLYEVKLSHNNSDVGVVSFVVSNPIIPDWIKDNAKLWSSTSIPDSEFIDGIDYLIEEKLITINSAERSFASVSAIPDWFKNNAKWWTDNQISDEDFSKSVQYLVKKGIIPI